MKRRHIISIIALVVIALGVAACYGFRIESLTVSDNPTANEYITLTGTWSLDSSGGTQLLVPVLLPSNWPDVEHNTEVLASCEALGITDLKLTYLDPTVSPHENWLGLGVRDYFNANVGFMGNKYGDMTWHFFYTENVVGEAPANSTIVVKVKAKAGSQNLLFNASVGIAKYPDGPHGWCYPTIGDTEAATNNPADLDFARANGVVSVQISGGEGFEDYISTPIVSTVPSKYRYGDIFAIEFAAGDTELKDADEIYMHFIAVLPNGDILKYEENNEQTLMKKVDGTTGYRRYIYPKELFGLTQQDNIEMLYVNFYDKTNTIKVEHPALSGYMLTQSEDTILK